MERYRRHGQTAKALTPTQNVDAIESFRLLVGSSLNLRNVVAEYLGMATEAEEKGTTVGQAFAEGMKKLFPSGGRKTVAEVLDEIQRLKERAPNLRPKTLKSFKTKAARMNKSIGDILVSGLSRQDIVDWLTAIPGKVRTRQNYRSTLAEVMRFAIAQRYASVNPLDSLTVQ